VEEKPVSLFRLTKAEYEVFLKVIEGKPNKIIAHELGITLRTVKAHRHAVMEKSGAQSIAELVRLAVRKGIIEP